VKEGGLAVNWIVLVLIACSGDSCTIVEAEASLATDAREEAIRKNCDASPTCFEMRRGFFIIRQAVPAAIPIVPPPPPPASSARSPGSRA
jgi:hypothetical protein